MEDQNERQTNDGLPFLEGPMQKMPSDGSRSDTDAWRSRYLACTANAERTGAELSWWKDAQHRAAAKPKGTLHLNAGTTIAVSIAGPQCGFIVTPKGGRPLRLRSPDAEEQQRWVDSLTLIVGELHTACPRLDVAR